ncbi:MAG: DUF4249 domain-containing protein [Bacteroidetes bacterium]|nr:MAG: DUF4249 domain-containing protein [Bacteroidota bacterium]
MFWRYLMVLFVFVIFSGSTCEREVELQLPEPPNRLVIYAAFTDSKELQVYLNSSRFVLDQAPEEYLPDVDVALFEGDQGEQMVQQLEIEIPGGRLVPFYTAPGFVPDLGKDYTIRANLEGFDPVEAHSTIPLPRHFSELSISDLVIEQNGNRIRYTYTVNLEFNDNPEEANFYHINLFQQVYTHPITGGDDEYVDLIPFEFSDSNDGNEILANISGGLLLEDDPLNGNYGFRVTYEINPATESLGKVFIELRTVSKEYYQFHSSVTRQSKSPGGVFTEPVFIFNNIDGGHGIFAGYSAVTDSLSIID